MSKTKYAYIVNRRLLTRDAAPFIRLQPYIALAAGPMFDPSDTDHFGRCIPLLIASARAAWDEAQDVSEMSAEQARFALIQIQQILGSALYMLNQLDVQT